MMGFLEPAYREEDAPVDEGWEEKYVVRVKRGVTVSEGGTDIYDDVLEEGLKQGYRPISISGYSDGGALACCLLFERIDEEVSNSDDGGSS